MKTLNINGIKLEMYDCIDEMPIVNFQKYNKYILIDSGIGSDIDSIDTHLINLAKLIKTDMAKAQQELQNMRQNMYMVVSEISPKYMAFVSLIHSINDNLITDLSDDNIKNIISELKNVKHSIIIDFIARIKKKLATELETYFPIDFNDSREKEIYDKIKQRTILQLKSIIEDKKYDDEIAAIDSYLFSLYKPKIFIGVESIEVKYDKQFETSCMYISQKANMNAKKMTVLEFYNTLSNLTKQAEAEAKAYKNTKNYGRR